MSHLAVVGDRDSIWGFKALGMQIHAVDSPQGALKALRELCNSQYKAVFITENYAEALEDEIEELEKFIALYPSIVIIPSHKGSKNLGMEKVRSLVEKAIGRDIFNQQHS